MPSQNGARCDQPVCLQPSRQLADRRLLDGLPDDISTGRRSAVQCDRAARPGGRDGRAFGPGQPGQFRSHAFVRTLKDHGLTGSMGRVGACGDNAAMESFFALLQKNVLDRQRWPDRSQLRLAIITWIERTSTAAAGNEPSDGSHPSNTRQSTGPHSRPEPPSPRVNQSRGSPISCQESLQMSWSLRRCSSQVGAD